MITSIVAWVTAHPGEVCGFLALGVIIGERAAALTANKTDDAIFGFIHKALSAVGLKFPEVK